MRGRIGAVTNDEGDVRRSGPYGRDDPLCGVPLAGVAGDYLREPTWSIVSELSDAILATRAGRETAF
jgi:hypothetical protein